MAEGDFSVYAKIQADTSNFEKGMKKAQTSATNLSSAFGNVSKVITKALSLTGIVVGTKAIVDFGKSCVQSANQANKQFRILDNTIKATGADAWTSTKDMAGMAKELSNETNYSVTEIQKMQSVLLGFRDITGETFKDASNAVMDMATVMGMDLTSAVQTVGKALDDPIKGLDSLRRQGFAFTDEQKAELAQLVKTGKKMEAQKIILDELSRTYGGAAKAGQDSFAKQRHSVENFTETLGNKLMPTVKMFAENSALAFNSLTGIVEDIDFNQVGAVIIATFDTIKNSLKDFSAPFKSIGDELKKFISGIDLKPFISVLENLINAFKRMNEIKLGRSIENIQNLKDVISGIGENIDLEKISEVINLIINGFVFLYEEVNKIFDTLRENIQTFVVNVWNSIKSIFEASNQALADSETDIKSWGDFFYNIFNNFFKSIQDVIYSITALIRGDWTLAWEYMKLACARVADSILDILSTIVNAFPKMVDKITEFLNGLIEKANKVRKWMGKETWDLIEPLRKADFSKSSGLEKFISDTEKKISDLTGKTADKNIKDMKRFGESSKGVLGKFVDNFKEATSKAKKELDNLSGEYKPELSSGSGSSTQEIEKQFQLYSEWETKLIQQRLDNLKEYNKDFSKEYNQLQMERIEGERAVALASAETEEEVLKINEYYDNEVLKEKKRFENEQLKYSKKRIEAVHKMNLDLIEQEREKAHQADSTGAETERINEYYDKKILEEKKRFEDEKRNSARETFNKIISMTKAFATKTIEVFKKVVSGIKSALSSVGNIFSKLFSFNVDDALDELLKFEDSILTFFVETLPKLPGFFESAVQSIVVLIQTVINTLDFDVISNIIESVINSIANLVSTIVRYVLQNADKITKGFIQLIKTLIQGISDWIKSGGWKELLQALLAIQEMLQDVVTENLPAIVDTIIEMLPDLVDTLIASIVSASKAFEKLIRPIIKLVLALIEAIFQILLSDEVFNAGIHALMELLDAIFKELIPALAKLIPKLIAQIIAFVVRNLPTLVQAIIEGLVKAFFETNWFEVVADIFMGFIDGFKALFGIHSPSTLFEGFGVNIIQGLWNGMKDMADWLWKNIKKLFTNLVKNIKNIFSKLGNILKDIFSDAWKNIKNAWSGVTNWFKNIGEGIKNAFQSVGETLKNIFSNMGDVFKEIFSNIGDWFKNIFSKLSGFFSSFIDVVGQGLNAIGDWIGSLLDKAKSLLSKVAEGAKSLGEKIWDNTIGRWFATGTNSAPRGLAVVGEAGPEIVQFHGGEKVYNNTDTQRMLSGSKSGSVFNVTFNNTQDTTAFAMMKQLKSYQRNLAFNGVL